MNTEMPVLLIDMDDTIVELLQSWCDYLNSKYCMNISANNITDWDMCKFFSRLTKEQIFEPLYCEDFWKTVNPKPNSVKYVEKLFNEGYNIFLCTSTDYRNVRAKYEYIIKHYFPYIEWNQVIVAYKKQMIKADYLIDDGIHNLENGDFIKILMTAPHNRGYNAGANGMVRADNWEEVYRIIKESNCHEK